jgi:arylsulfatase A-like enzyme
MIEGGSPKIYGAMMTSMDAGIGRVLAALQRAKIERDTLVIFTSDNGGERYSFNWPFSFQKMYLFEGGTRVPAIVRWPGTIPAGQVTAQAAITIDGARFGVSDRRREPDRGLRRQAPGVRS